MWHGGEMREPDRRGLVVVELAHPLLNVLVAKLFTDHDPTLPDDFLHTWFRAYAWMRCRANTPVGLHQELVTNQIGCVDARRTDCRIRLALGKVLPRSPVNQREYLYGYRWRQLLNPRQDRGEQRNLTNICEQQSKIAT